MTEVAPWILGPLALDFVCYSVLRNPFSKSLEMPWNTFEWLGTLWSTNPLYRAVDTPVKCVWSQRDLLRVSACDSFSQPTTCAGFLSWLDIEKLPQICIARYHESHMRWFTQKTKFLSTLKLYKLTFTIKNSIFTSQKRLYLESCSALAAVYTLFYIARENMPYFMSSLFATASNDW